MSSKNEPTGEIVDPQALMTLLTLDERLRSGRVPDEQILQPAETDDHILRTGMEALLELEAAIPRSGHSMPSWAPRRIGRFELRSVLGAGGFAVVYLAYDPQLTREVALKVPRPHALIQPELRQRFVNEARAAARLDHPAIVQVFEAGSDGDLPYIACALCEGPTLEDWLSSRNRPLDPKLAAEVVRRLADGLQYSHDRGILHRDIKPGNVLLFPVDPVGQTEFPFHARISDFGLAKLLEDPQLDSVTSQLIGTPRFMAPELLGSAARTSSVAADVYSLGAVLYAMLIGQAPFGSASLGETLKRIAGEDPIPPELINRSVGKDLSLICLKCLEKSASDRYASAAELRDDLQRFLAGQCVVARQTPLLVRVRKWCRRYPLGAALAVVSSVFVLSIAVMTYRYTVSLRGLQGRLQATNKELRQRVRELDEAARLAKVSQNQAIEERRNARTLLQISDINLAGRMWRQGDTKGAQSLLEPWIDERVLRHEKTSDSGKDLSSADVALRYLWRRITVPSQTLRNSTQAVWWMHPDVSTGQLLLAGSEGKVELVRLGEIAGGETRADEAAKAGDSLKASAGELSCVTLSDDRTLAATAGDDGIVRIWRVESLSGPRAPALTLMHEIPVVVDGSVYGVLFLRGTHHCISCARSPSLTVWDADTGQQLREVVTAHPRFIESIVMSPDGTQLATAGADGLVEIFRLPDLVSIQQIQASEKPLSMAAFSTDGRRLICGGWDKLLRLYDLESGAQIGNYLSMAGIYCVVCNPRDEVLVGDRDGAMTLFRIPASPGIPADGEPVVSLRPEKRWAGHTSPVSAICWAPDSPTASSGGSWLSADRSGAVKIWNAGVSALTVVPSPADVSGKSPGTDTPVLPLRTVHLRGTENGIEIISLQKATAETCLSTGSPVTSLAEAGPSGQAVAGDADGHVYWIEEGLDGWKITNRLAVSPGVSILRMFSSSDQRMLCAIDREWRLAVVDTRLRTIVHTAAESPVAVVDPDGEHLIRSMSGVDDMQVIRMVDGEVCATLRGHRSTISRIQVTPDGQTCISTSHDRTVCLWDCSRWTLRKQATGHTSPVVALAISPTGDFFATADEAGVIRLWDVASGRELTQLDEHVPGLQDLKFTADGTALIAWDTLQQISRIQL